MPKLSLLKRAGSLTERHDSGHGLHQLAVSMRPFVGLDLRSEARPEGIAVHRIRRLESVGRHPVRALRQLAKGEIECNGFCNHTPPRRLEQPSASDPLSGREAPGDDTPRNSPAPTSAPPRHRTAAPTPTPTRCTTCTRTTTASTRRYRLGRPRLLQPHRRQQLRPAREPHRSEHRVPRRTARRRPAHRRQATPAARRAPHRPRAALLPDHVVGVRPRARRLHREVPRQARRTSTSTSPAPTAPTPARRSRHVAMPPAPPTTRPRARSRSRR